MSKRNLPFTRDDIERQNKEYYKHRLAPDASKEAINEYLKGTLYPSGDHPNRRERRAAGGKRERKRAAMLERLGFTRTQHIDPSIVFNKDLSIKCSHDAKTIVHTNHVHLRDFRFAP